jgi:hypothetical protein
VGAPEITAVKVVDGFVQVFQAKADEIWPGYNLAERPVLLYKPSQWALLLNSRVAVDGFYPLPQSWPHLKGDVQFQSGTYRDLAGQLAFDVTVGTKKVVAVPVSDLYAQRPEPALALFALLVHEAFHQYQNEAFVHEPDSQSEERYPIQDRENTALAFLEIQLLTKALDASVAKRRDEVESCLKEFVAVRDARWRRNQFVRAFEHHEEIHEGTAKYVEVKSLSLTGGLHYSAGLPGSLADDFRSASLPGYLLREFSARVTEGSVTPADMPRNRIYPVGAALGLFLDDIDPEWKKRVTINAGDVSFLSLIKDGIHLEDGALPDLLAEAKKTHKYEDARQAADRLITAHEKGFRDALAAFQAQRGYRIQIKLKSDGLNRSRSTGTTRWTVDEGRRSLCPQYNVYALRRSDLSLNLHGVAVLEEQDWDARTKTVTFFVPGVHSLLVDGAADDRLQPSARVFKHCELSGENLEFTTSSGGLIRIVPGGIEFDLYRSLNP